MRRSSPVEPGWCRRRRGRGFQYLDDRSQPLSAAEVDRIRALAIPPAWRAVWICPDPAGHLQAIGTDAAGRTQYLYHPAWRGRRDRAKFDRVLAAAARLPSVRRRVSADLALPGMPFERAAALAVRMLDLGCFRIGSDCYADANGSFGLTTLERHHLRRLDGGVRFRFPGKSGVEHRIWLDDADVLVALQVLRRRRDRGERLFAFRETRGWRQLTSDAVNNYLAELFGGDFTAKDFRTWHAGVVAAQALAVTSEDGLSEASRRRAITAAVAGVAGYLGNTPAVARGSYIDPRIIERYRKGVTIPPGTGERARSAPARQAALEAAVRRLLH